MTSIWVSKETLKPLSLHHNNTRQGLDLVFIFIVTETLLLFVYDMMFLFIIFYKHFMVAEGLCLYVNE